MIKQKPTKSDLIALINYAAHVSGSALACFYDDRQPDRARQMEERLGSLQKLLHEAASHYPVPKASPWVNLYDTN